MSSPRLLFLSYYYPPSTQMAARRARQITDDLLQHGWTVDVVTTGTADLSETTSVERLRIVRVRDPLQRVTAQAQATAPAAAGGWRTGLIRLGRAAIPFDSSLFWCLRAARQAQRLLATDEPVCVLSSAPPLATTLAGCLLRRAGGQVRWIHELRDLVATNPIYAWGQMRRWLNFRLERWLLRRADGLVFLTDEIADDYAALYRLPACGAVIYNGYDAEFAARIKPRRPARDGRLRLLHVGSFYGARNPLPLLGGLRRLLDNQPDLAARVHLTLVGQLGQTPAEVAAVHERIKTLRLVDSVHVLPPVPHDKLAELYGLADVLVLLTHVDGSSRYAIPGKLFEYIGAGRKILAVTNDPLPTRIIEANGLGWVCAPDEHEIHDALAAIANELAGGGDPTLPLEQLEQFSFACQAARFREFVAALWTRGD